MGTVLNHEPVGLGNPIAPLNWAVPRIEDET
jgi:hypothetical protein